MGGASDDIANALAIDSSGRVLITGVLTGGSTFASATVSTTLSGGGFVLALDLSGNFLWAAPLNQGGVYGGGLGVTADSAGNVYVGGNFNGLTGTGSNTPSSPYGAFVSALNGSGAYRWTDIISGSVAGEALASDPSGNLTLIGGFAETVDFDPGPAVSLLSSPGQFRSPYLLRLDTNGGFLGVEQFGSTGTDLANALSFDSQGNIYVAGRSDGITNFDPGLPPPLGNASYDAGAAGQQENFVVRLNATPASGAPNVAPSFTLASSSVSVDENAAEVTVDKLAQNISAGPASEADQALDFLATNDNPSLFSQPPGIDPNTGNLVFSPAPDASGVAHITVTLHDNGGTANGGVDTSQAQTFVITVNPVNQPPSFTAGGDQTVNENAGAQTVPGWATKITPGAGNFDVGQSLNFIVATDNNALFSVPPAIDPTNGTLAYTPAANASGVARVSVKLHDNGGTANGGVDTSAQQTLTITVNLVNEAPTFSAGADQTVPVNAGAQTVTNWATNMSPGAGNGDAGQTLNFVVTTDNDSLFAVPPVIDVTTGTLTYTPAANASGVAHVAVKLHDNGGTANGGVDTSLPATFAITIQAPMSPHQKYVTAVYEDVLGRAPDATGLMWWTLQLDNGAPTSSVAEQIAHSAEYYAKFVIQPAYLKLLGRPADAAGTDYWTSQMDAGVTDQELEAYLVSSQEFYQKSGGTNLAWIDAVYKLLLGRPADSGGESYWTTQLAAGETLGQAAQGIAGSQENNTQLINDDYFHYLGRPADAGGLSFWLAAFAAGQTNEDVIAGFTGSAEYYKEHTSSS